MKKPPAIHFRKHNGRPVCGTSYRKAKFTEDFGAVTCITCKDRYPIQREESKDSLYGVVRTAALSEEEVFEILRTAFREELVIQVMDG